MQPRGETGATAWPGRLTAPGVTRVPSRGAVKVYPVDSSSRSRGDSAGPRGADLPDGLWELSATYGGRGSYLGACGGGGVSATPVGRPARARAAWLWVDWSLPQARPGGPLGRDQSDVAASGADREPCPVGPGPLVDARRGRTAGRRHAGLDQTRRTRLGTGMHGRACFSESGGPFGGGHVSSGSAVALTQFRTPVDFARGQPHVAVPIAPAVSGDLLAVGRVGQLRVSSSAVRAPGIRVGGTPSPVIRAPSTVRRASGRPSAAVGANG